MRKSSRTLDDIVKVIKTMVSEHQSSHTFRDSVPSQVYTKDISSHIISEGIAKNFHYDSIIFIFKIWVPSASLLLSYPEQQSLSQINPRCVTGGKIGITDVGRVCFTHVLGTNNWDTTLLVKCGVRHTLPNCSGLEMCCDSVGLGHVSIFNHESKVS